MCIHNSETGGSIKVTCKYDTPQGQLVVFREVLNCLEMSSNVRYSERESFMAFLVGVSRVGDFPGVLDLGTFKQMPDAWFA